MIPQVHPSELTSWLESASEGGVTPVILDVREPWELQTASIKPEGFTMLAIPMNDIPARLAELDPGVPIACLCHHGARSLRVATFLTQNGFSDVVNLNGGIDAWSAARDASVPRY